MFKPYFETKDKSYIIIFLQEAIEYRAIGSHDDEGGSVEPVLALAAASVEKGIASAIRKEVEGFRADIADHHEVRRPRWKVAQ